MAPTHDRVRKAEALLDEMIGWRRRLHAHPELSFQEQDTAAMAAEVLRQIPGMKVETRVGCETAVVGTLSSGEGPVIALRADMDALPITESALHDYSSRREGIMHACGHDAHTSMLLGAAHLIADSFQSEPLKGTVKFIFQPAEEMTDEKGWSGAPYMIEAGVLDDVDVVIALHVNPEAPAGHLWFHSGYSMASSDVFEGLIRGTGGHGGYPHLAKDPVWMTTQILQTLYSTTGRWISPLEPSVISIGQIQAGSASNIIPSEVYIQGILRSYDPSVREQLYEQLEKAFSLVKTLGGYYDLTVERGEPALFNDPFVTAWLKQTAEELDPTYSIFDQPFGLGSEDFAYMTQRVPGAMFFLGCALPDQVKRELHTPIFDIDESCLSIGAAIFAETAIRYLKGQFTIKGHDKA